MSEADSPYALRERPDGITVVTLFDDQVLSEGRGHIYTVLDRLGPSAGKAKKRIVLSLINVKAINSAAIGVLINFQKRVKDAHGSLRLCDIDPYIHNVLSLTKVDQVLRLYPTENEAVASFGQAPERPGPGGPSWLSRIFKK